MSGTAAELAVGPEPLGRAEIIHLATNGLGWRSYLRVHPAAELFPRKGADDGSEEQCMFEESIKKDGLKVPILIWHNWENRSYITYVVDGVRCRSSKTASWFSTVKSSIPKPTHTRNASSGISTGATLVRLRSAS